MSQFIEKALIDHTVQAVHELYQAEIQPSQIALQETRKEFEGQITIVVFRSLNFLKSLLNKQEQK